MTKTIFRPGDRVFGGIGEDYDIGTVDTCPVRRSMKDCVWVRWDSGQATWTPVSLLNRKCEE